jgi:hypothetical protein
MIFPQIKSEQIVSVNLNTMLFCKTPGLASLSVFTNVISLILLKCQHVPAISQYEKYFPNLIRLSLWYDNEINLITLSNILNQLQRPIKRLEIHCTGILCPHYHSNWVNMGCTQNFTIEYFLIDIGQFPLPSTNECCHEYRSCFLTTITDLIKRMANIRHVRLITNRFNLEQLFDANEWKSLINVCYQWKTITMEVWRSVLEKEELSQKAINSNFS